MSAMASQNMSLKQHVSTIVPVLLRYSAFSAKGLNASYLKWILKYYVKAAPKGFNGSGSAGVAVLLPDLAIN